MKLASALFFFMGTAFPLVGSPTLAAQDEITTLLDLIDISKKNLEDQQKLLKIVLDFKKKKEAFVGDPTSAKLATVLVKAAMRVHDEIEKNNLTYLFSSEFLLEVDFFNQVGRKSGLLR